MDIGGLSEGGGNGSGGTEPGGTVALVSSTATISDLTIGYNDIGASSASTLTMDRSTLEVAPAITGDLEPFILGQGVLSLIHGSILSSEVETWFGSQGPAAVTIDGSTVDLSATNNALLIGGGVTSSDRHPLSAPSPSAAGAFADGDQRQHRCRIDHRRQRHAERVGPISMGNNAVIASAGGTLVLNGGSGNTDILAARWRSAMARPSC